MGRKIVLIRHGERFDFFLGKNWFDQIFDSHTGTYTSQKSINLPATLLTRQGMPESYRHDCPLTLTGLEQGKIAGEKIAESHFLNGGEGTNFDIYVSPSLRSIQTAAAILEGMNKLGRQIRRKLKVEPSLFEWAGFCMSTGLPQWVTIDELVKAGHPIDQEYQPFLTPDRVDTHESIGQYYKRTSDFVSNILKTSENDILLVGHSATPDAGTRLICGKPEATTFEQMLMALRPVPYAGFAVAEQQEETGRWVIIKSADK